MAFRKMRSPQLFDISTPLVFFLILLPLPIGHAHRLAVCYLLAICLHTRQFLFVHLVPYTCTGLPVHCVKGHPVPVCRSAQYLKLVYVPFCLKSVFAPHHGSRLVNTGALMCSRVPCPHCQGH